MHKVAIISSLAVAAQGFTDNANRCPVVKNGVLLQKDAFPGAGRDLEKVKEVAGAKSYTDAYFHVKCMTDDMAKFGDAHSTTHKLQYAKWANHANVSVVRYTTVVPKADQQKMTREVCYGFCRSIPDMQFFGITNGRDCYCSPYFKQGAGDSSDCDAPCDGDNSQTCGGKSKSDVFQLHTCGDLTQLMKNGIDYLEAAEPKFLAAMNEFFPGFGDEYEKYCPDHESGEVSNETPKFLEEGMGGIGKQLRAMSKSTADPSAGKASQQAFDAVRAVQKDVIAPSCTIDRRIKRVVAAAGVALGMTMGGRAMDLKTQQTAEKAVADLESINADIVLYMEKIEELGKSQFNVHLSESAAEQSERKEAEKKAFDTYYKAAGMLSKKGEEERDATCQGTAIKQVSLLGGKSECARHCIDSVGSDGCEGFEWFAQCAGFDSAAASSNACGGAKERGLCVLLKEIKQVSLYKAGEESGCTKGAATCFIGAESKKGWTPKVENRDMCFATSGPP